jgi:putative endonuclease
MKYELEKKRSYIFGHLCEWRVVFDFLIKGYIPLRRRYRNKYGEIDLIFKKSSLIVFVEVKGRKGMLPTIEMGEIVKQNQKARIQRAANFFIKNNNLFDIQIRFDIVVVTSIWKKTYHFTS